MLNQEEFGYMYDSVHYVQSKSTAPTPRPGDAPFSPHAADYTDQVRRFAGFRGLVAVG